MSSSQHYYGDDGDAGHGGKQSVCCPANKCDEVCPDVCEQLCLSGTVQRGEFVVPAGSGTDPSDVDRKAAAFVITLSVNNCTGSVITNFRPRLQFRLLDPNATDNNSAIPDAGTPQIVTIDAEQVRGIAASIGCPNRKNDNSDPTPPTPWNGNTSTAVLSKGVNLPPGCANFKLYLFLFDTEEAAYTSFVLLPPVYSVGGTIKCCFGECLPVHKSVHLDCECLPYELDQ